MVLSDHDRAFLARRRASVRLFPGAVLVCILAWLGLWSYLLVTRPLLSNPLHFLAHAASVAEHDLAPLAALAPLAVSALFLTVLAFLLIALGLLLDQRRLVRLLDTLDAPAPERGSSHG